MNKLVSRRRFAGLLGTGTAYVALQSSIVLTRPSLGPLRSLPIPGRLRLSANENPYGPSPMALKALADATGLIWRYPDEHVEALTEALAKLNAVSPEQVLMGNGSSEILMVAAAALCSPTRKLVVANPTFEAISDHARAVQAEVIRIDLTREYAHDLPGMLARANEAGLIYLCNPNNPTASITSKEAIRAFLAKVPNETTVLVDEAYHHYVESSDYESVIPLVKQYANLVVSRTFSKIYGMAGLRCGYCIARPELIQRLRTHQSWDNLNIMALVAASVSLQDPVQVEQGRRRNSEAKKYVYSAMDRLGYRYIPSHANFLMIDLRREVKPIIRAMKEQQVDVGRVFPALANFLRVTIGTRPQMERFVSVFQTVMATGSSESKKLRKEQDQPQIYADDADQNFKWLKREGARGNRGDGR